MVLIPNLRFNPFKKKEKRKKEVPLQIPVRAEDRWVRFRRYNWDLLKFEFMKGPWETMADFHRFKGLRLTPATLSNHAKGWVAEKRTMLSQATTEATKNIVRNKSEEIEQMRFRQADDARVLQEKGKKALEVLKPKTTEDARKLWVTGAQEERAALGATERGGGPSNLTQVNVNVPKTRFDEIFDDADVTGILQLIAEVKRERARRTGASPFIEGQTEANHG